MSAWSDAVAALSPYLWWKLDETSGTTAADASGNGRTGSYASATLNQAGLIAGDAGGKSVALALTTSNVQRLTGVSIPNVGVTYVTSFKTTTLATSGQMFRMSTAVSLEFAASNLVARINGSTALTLAYDPALLCDGNPHLIVYVVRAASAELWVDGAMVASGEHSVSPPANSGQLQVKQGSAGPVGTYDDTFVVTSAISSAQIAGLYAAWTGGVSIPAVSAPQTIALSGSAAVVPVGVAAGSTSVPVAGSASATPVGVVAAASSVALASAAAAAVAVAATAAVPVESSASAYAVGDAVPVVADTTLTVSSTADASTVHAVEAGTVVAVTSSATASVVTPPPSGTQDVDLSTFVDLYSTTTYDGTGLSGATKTFTFPLALDPATAYTVELDIEGGSSTGGNLYSSLGPTEAQVDLSQWHTLGTAIPIESGTGTLVFAIGPGIAGWDQAVLDGEHHATFSIGPSTITAIRITPPIGGVTPEPSVPVATETQNRIAGRARAGVAVALWEPPVVAAPANEPLSERHVGAVAFSDVTLDGAQPVYTTSAATKKRMRHRIVVGGKDVSFYRGIATPEPGYQLAEPMLWGPTSITFPQIVAAFETPGKNTPVSNLRWCAKGKPVVIQRVSAAGEIVATDYRGVVVAHDVDSGGKLRLEVGGHGTGRAALRHKPVPIFRDTLDVGRLAWAAVRDLGLRFEPRLGPKTGIKQALWGGMDYLTYVSELCARAWDRDGTQWTVMPSEAGVYRMKRKDRETVDFTVFTDDKRNIAALRSDAAEEPNRIFGSGVTPKGQRVRFGVYPGLKPSKPAPYPFSDGRAFGLGTTDADTDTGDGITIMLRTLWGMGYLSLEDTPGDFDGDARLAISALQDDAGIHQGPLGYLDMGQMDVETWEALFDFDVTGFNLRGSRIEPAAQAPRTRRYNRSASGRVMGRNPRFDRHALVVDRALDFGAGFTRHRMREWANAEIARGEDNWVGTVEVTTGGVLHGEVAPGAVIGGDDIMDVRAIKPGMNAWLPTFAGGVLVHVSAVEISYDGNGIPQAKLYVDTQARDAMQVWDIIRRNRETRRDPARKWKGNRASGELKDSITEWDEVGGVLYDDVDLQPGWNVVPVVAGQEGTVARIRLRVTTELGDAGKGVEFACAVFGKKISPARLNTMVKAPLADSVIESPETDEDDEDEKKPPPLIGDRAWERKSVRKALRANWHLYSAGTHREPCGYSPGRKTWETTTSQAANPDYEPDADDNSTGTDDDEFISVTTETAHGKLTGEHQDDAGFSYRTARQPVLYLAVYVRREAVLKGGRVMWNQLEAGA